MAEETQPVLIETITELHDAAGLTWQRSCDLVGMAKSTFYRIDRDYHHYQPVENPLPQKDRVQPAALSPFERAEVVKVLEMKEYEDCSIGQAYWRAFDDGLLACSERTAYRIAAEEKLVGDRRPQKAKGRGGARPRPELPANAPNELWTWDITDLPGPTKGIVYKLYLILDVFSRKPIGFRIETQEDKILAADMFTTAIITHGTPEIVHADNGSSMRSKLLVDALIEAMVVASFSRPHVSNDNPFSESMFKTIKYDINRPERFDSIEHARAWTEAFLTSYDTEHRHSSLGWHTPADIYNGNAAIVQQRRQQSLDHYYEQHPERFRNRPKAPKLPKPTGININTNDDLSQTG